MVRVPSFQHQDSLFLYNDSDVLNEYDAELFRDGSSMMNCSNSEPNFSQDDALSSKSEPNDCIAYQEDTKLTLTQELEQTEIVKKPDLQLETRRLEEEDLTPIVDFNGWNDIHFTKQREFKILSSQLYAKSSLTTDQCWRTQRKSMGNFISHSQRFIRSSTVVDEGDMITSGFYSKDAVIKDEVAISNFTVTAVDDESSAQEKFKGEANALVKCFEATHQSSPSQSRKHESSHE